MDGLVLRRMQEGDLDQIASLESEIFSDPWSRNAYQDILGKEHYCALVLAVPGDVPEEIVGYLCGMTVLDEGELHRIAVSPARRGEGYGGRLMEGFLAILRDRGISSVYLEVRAGNAPAIGLYQKNGFTQIGIRKGYYQNPKEDAWVMQKQILSG